MFGRRVPVAVAVLALAGCGGGSSSTTGSSRAPDNGSAPRAAHRLTVSTAARISGGRVTVSMAEFRFKPRALVATAGKLRVTAKNDGREEHEFVLIRTNKRASALPMKGGEVSEAHAVGEIPEQKPGEKATHTFNLKPGRYVYICNYHGHYKAGMHGTLSVR
jgi:uncharacterized cupredoxin-like copper-binding protein